jgi:hypothetical protein
MVELETLDFMDEYAFAGALSSALETALDLAKVTTPVQFDQTPIVTLFLPRNQNSISTSCKAFHQLVDFMKLLVSVSALAGHRGLVQKIMQMGCAGDADLLAIPEDCLKTAGDFHSDSSVKLMFPFALIAEPSEPQEVRIRAGSASYSIRAGFAVRDNVLTGFALLFRNTQ